MKQFIFFTASILVAGTGYSQEDQHISVPRSLIKLAPQNFTQNELKILTEFFLDSARKKSLVFAVYGRLSKKYFNNFYPNNQYYQPGTYSNSEGSYNGLGSEIAYRKYVGPFKQLITNHGKPYLQGIYSSIYMQGGYFVGKNTNSSYYFGNPNPFGQYDTEEKVTNFGLGFTIGLQRTIWEVLFIDVYVGGGMQFSNRGRNEVPLSDPGYQGVMPNFGLQVGIRL